MNLCQLVCDIGKGTQASWGKGGDLAGFIALTWIRMWETSSEMLSLSYWAASDSTLATDPG